MIYSSWDIKHDRLKLVILGHFSPLYPPPPLKTQKIKILGKMKKIAGDKIILHMCTKIHNHMVYGSLEYRVRLTEFFVILGHFFALLPHWQSKKSKFWKNTWRYHWFPLVHHKWQSYHAWFLRYGVWQTEFAILDRFFPFWSPNNPEN